MKDASTNTYRVGQKSTSHSFLCVRLLERLTGARVGDLALVGHERAFLNVIVEIKLKRLVFRKRQDERRQISREQQARMERHRCRQVERRENGDAADLDRRARFRQLAVSATVGAEIDDDGSRA